MRRLIPAKRLLPSTSGDQDGEATTKSLPNKADLPHNKNNKKQKLFKSPLLAKSAGFSKDTRSLTGNKSSQKDAPRSSSQDTVNFTIGTTEGTCYNVVYRKKQNKKHKTWDADGILLLQDKNVTLLDTEGKVYVHH